MKIKKNNKLYDGYEKGRRTSIFKKKINKKKSVNGDNME